MADNTATFMLNGEVSLAAFAAAISHFNELMRALSAEANVTVDWIIADLQVSSAMAVARGDGPTPDVTKVLAAYEDVGEALEKGENINHAESVQLAASNLVSIEDKRITNALMQTADRDALVPVQRRPPQPAKLFVVPRPVLKPAVRLQRQAAYGALRGRVQTLTNRSELRFTLYDLMYDRAVSCYFAEGKKDEIHGMWGRLASVEGMISRDPATGRPLAIRQVAAITPLPEAESVFGYQAARGAAPSLTGMSPEEAIRRVRDAN